MSTTTPKADPPVQTHASVGAKTIALRIAIVLILVLADQWSKSAVFEAISGGSMVVEGMERDIHGHDRLPVLGNFLGFMRSENPGAAFGRFGDYPHILVGGRIIAVAFLCWLLFSTRRGERLSLWAIILVLSGALGNLVDNLWTGPMYDDHPYGKVRDFIDAWFFSEGRGWDYHFHTFNVADACITVGAVAWILAGLFSHDPADPEPPVDDEESKSEEATPA